MGRPLPSPRRRELAATGLRGLVRTPFSLAGRALGALSHPSTAVGNARQAAEGVGEIVWAGLNPAPPTPLNVEIGPHRRFSWVRLELEDFKTVKNAFGGTVNDVVLTVVAGALREFLRARGVRTEGLELRALVPVSIRGAGRAPRARQPHRGHARPAARLHRRPDRPAARGQAGDGRPEGVQAGARRRGDLQRPEPRAADDPRAGLADQLLHAAVQPDRHERARARSSRSTCSGASSRTSSRSRSCPRTTRWRSRSCPTTATSTFGLLGDYDALPDIEDIADGLDASLEELLLAARKAAKKGKRKAEAAEAEAEAEAAPVSNGAHATVKPPA